jgi:hypothetical protein
MKAAAIQLTVLVLGIVVGTLIYDAIRKKMDEPKAGK